MTSQMEQSYSRESPQLVMVPRIFGIFQSDVSKGRACAGSFLIKSFMAVFGFQIFPNGLKFRIFESMYPPVNQHGYGKWIIYRWFDLPIKLVIFSWFLISITMSIYQRVYKSIKQQHSNGYFVIGGTSKIPNSHRFTIELAPTPSWTPQPWRARRHAVRQSLWPVMVYWPMKFQRVYQDSNHGWSRFISLSYVIKMFIKMCIKVHHGSSWFMITLIYLLNVQSWGYSMKFIISDKPMSTKQQPGTWRVVSCSPLRTLLWLYGPC